MLKSRTLKAGHRLVSAALALVAALVPSAAAHGSDTEPTCEIMRQSYGVTAAGALVEHDYCVSAPLAGRQSSRTLAPAGWWQGGVVFASGMAGGSSGVHTVFYQVARDGRLLWSTDGDGSAVGPSQPIGAAALIDWRQYRTLFSTFRGNIYGVEATGRILHWVHTGRADGSDTWLGPDVVGVGFTVGQRVGYFDGDGFLGTDKAQPRAVIHWTAGAAVVGSPEPVVGPVDTRTLSFTNTTLGYGRADDGRIAMVTQTSAGGGWTATPLASGQFAVVFAGPVQRQLIGLPYEWQ